MPVRVWECPSCDVTAVTGENQAGTPMHRCAGLSGMTVPHTPAGEAAEHRPVERQDYIAGDDVQTFDGHVVMSVVTVRDTGQDCTVYAPTAIGSGY